ncbi:DNA-processing protein DprA [Flavihumibacter petaseus]|uniref:Smf protein n=1 Tax=Flavihumibacter petaseus NBRC 106054 TaxID=1220578 RepID=A0A0E9N7B2_9BACT|nr:DNA-processing protein DprA [Flavihumibacter petaseus]GAO45591.1 Smf protein [Flavihumibacter petaseus NBRC 106054]
MASTETVLQVALTRLPYIGPVHAKALIEKFRTASAIFAASESVLEKMNGIGLIRAKSITQFNDFRECELVLQRSADLGCETLFLGSPAYPASLYNVNDPPTLLYCRGSIDLNRPRKLAVIGTRHHSEYGRLQTESILRQLVPAAPLIISGMAYGIDGLAHRTALKLGLPTIGILAHGLHTVYPAEHRLLATEMLQHGGMLISEFPPGVKPDRHNFPVRNRIVAGIAEALLVIETGKQGGSMITAGLANGYNKYIFAVPGRITDQRSSGCNLLLQQRIASPFFETSGFLSDMNWQVAGSMYTQPPQATIPFDLDPAETILVNLLGKSQVLSIDALYPLSGLSAGVAASALLSLEIRNIIRVLPGKRYQLCL